MSLTSRILLLDVTENGPCGLIAESGMSALGQKQTAVRNPMSALPPKADMCSAIGDVRYGPKADIAPTFLHHEQNQH
jgi:hypothetical protein